MTSVEPRINYQSLAAQGRLKRLAKRLYHTVARKRAQAKRFAVSGDFNLPDTRSGPELDHQLDKPETAVTVGAIRSDSAGRLLALDLGAKRVGVAVSDELRITANPLPAIERRSWKDLLSRVADMIESYDARGLVIGLPLSLDGAEGSAARDARATAAKFQLSLHIPVYLQDERLTTLTATAHLKETGRSARDIKRQVDSESARVILGDFIAHAQSLEQE